MATLLPRFLFARSGELSRSYINAVDQFQVRRPRCGLYCRYASNRALPPKHTLLEKPSRFNPPSHPARRNRSPPKQYPGPPLSAPEREAQKTKQYPHMMPPEGSFMRWFLTNRSIHIWITLSTLTSLAIFAITINFKQTSPFAKLLPALDIFLSHPIDYMSQCIEVYKMHTAHISAITAERRKKKVDDVQKRAQYRKAHGLDKDQGLGGWTAKDEKESLGPALKMDGAVGKELASLAAVEAGDGASGRTTQKDVYMDWEGRKKPIKKWLGIW